MVETNSQRLRDVVNTHACLIRESDELWSEFAQYRALWKTHAISNDFSECSSQIRFSSPRFFALWLSPRHVLCLVCVTRLSFQGTDCVLSFLMTFAFSLHPVLQSWYGALN